MSDVAAQELPEQPQAAAAAHRRRRGSGWSRRKSKTAEPSSRAVGRPAGSRTGSALLAKELPDPEWRSVMSNPLDFLWRSDYRTTFLRELQIYDAAPCMPPSAS